MSFRTSCVMESLLRKYSRCFAVAHLFARSSRSRPRVPPSLRSGNPVVYVNLRFIPHFVRDARRDFVSRALSLPITHSLVIILYHNRLCQLVYFYIISRSRTLILTEPEQGLNNILSKIFCLNPTVYSDILI